MPAGARSRANSVFGTVSDDPLTSGAASFNSNQLVLLPVISGGHAIITLDPLRQYGDPEIVVVTAHTAASTVATITRGTYGTTARTHPNGTVWAHALTTSDTIEILTSTTRPGDPYIGELIYETDNGIYKTWSGISWDTLSGGPAPRMGWHVSRAIGNSQSIPVGASPTNIIWDTEHQDTPNNFTVNNTTLTVPTGGDGLWQITLQVNYTANATYLGLFARITAGGFVFLQVESDDVGTSYVPSLNVSATIPLVAGNTIIAATQHGATGAQTVNGRLLAYRITQ